MYHRGEFFGITTDAHPHSGWFFCFGRSVLNWLKPLKKDAGVLSQEAPRSPNMPSLLREAVGGEILAVHRLDRETGGVMVFARNKRAAAALSEDIAAKRWEKRYLALVSSPWEENEGEMEDLLYFDRSKNKVFPVKRDRKGVKRALLHYRFLKRHGGYALAEVTPVTGRTHQIRVQFASRKMPLYGDRKYGGTGEVLGLFSHSLTFFHPVTKKELSFSALPEKKGPWALFLEE